MTDKQRNLQNKQSIDEDESSLAYLITKKHKSFVVRNSLLDDYTSDSDLNKSQFKGMYNFGILFSCGIIAIFPLKKYILHGSFFDYGFFNSFKNEYLMCLLTWPLFYIWSYTALILQILVIRGVPHWVIVFLQHLTQTSLFVYSMYQAMSRDWCSTHIIFTCFVSCTHFMKMHSYTNMNWYYREDWKKCSQNKDKKPNSNYPNNISFSNFTLYMWSPVLVYEYEYPRTKKIRAMFIVRKVLECSMTIICGYILISEHIYPVIAQGNKINVFTLLNTLIIPFIFLILMLFFCTFELILQFFAEITRFGDRLFYYDYWNSTTFEEFNRKWNRPVHMFLYRHVYLECIYYYKTSKLFAQIMTFGFSACLHEYITMLVFKTFRPIIFLFMIYQIPLFYVTRFMRNTKFGNLFFWFGIILGEPLMLTMYLRSDPSVTQRFTE